MNNWKPKNLLFVVVIGTIGLILTVLLREKKKEDTLVRLNAFAFFDDSRIIVSNNDTMDYLHADITVNGYYKIINTNLQAGETYTFWPVEFVHMNGKPLPANQRPQQVSIWCELKQGGNGFFSVKF